MSRIAATFARLKAEGRTGLVAFITAGYPDVASTVELVEALAAGGADAIELGVPFSDPLADGATIQRAGWQALGQGVTPWTCLDVARRLRERGLTLPLLLMGYYNPWLAAGLKTFARAAAEAGIDGFIAVDLPPEEAEEFLAVTRPLELDLIFLVAPTSSADRLAAVAKAASGFVYCVSVAGTTGARGDLPAELPAFIARVREQIRLPLAVGFGVSRPEHVARIGQLCEAAVIGSAIIDQIDNAAPHERVAKVREYVEVVTGRRRS
ncbi:MAG TPA: tryptophan synthase subunit alpha [Dehalococcoidia bacterium]|nr:tryptophan synthase subunit alpha [Dehalococcoidia bacterium]